MPTLLVAQPHDSPPLPSLALAAANGTDIPNGIDSPPSSEAIAHQKRARSFRALDPSRYTELAPASGRYNCFGLVFAARRTSLFLPNLRTTFSPTELLSMDGFRMMLQPAPGDVAAYRSKSGDIEHVGFVTHLQPFESTKVVYVWSKWGALGEYLHQSHVTPFPDCNVEFWRLSP